MLNKKKIKKLIEIILIFIIVCCCVMLFPQTRKLFINIVEKVLERELNHDIWMKIIFKYLLYVICFFCFMLIFLFDSPLFIKYIKFGLDKYGEKILIFSSIGIIALSVIVRIIMYLKCRSLWGDEAEFAANIISRNWFELLVPPLDYNQSAPVFYVVIEKIIGSLFGYSIYSLRLFSFLAFIGLLICETIFIKKAFNSNSYQVAFVVVMNALLPSYIWYSNELKPYMSDVFFVILIILLYFLYTNKKINLITLVILCILFLGFSTPVIFFTGGILLSEFLIAIFNNNRKNILCVIISGIVVIIIFSIYYYWWFSPISEFMNIWWTRWHNQRGNIIEIKELFTGFGNSSSEYVWVFVPIAILGIYSLVVYKNKIAYMIALSLFLAFLASLIGKYPLANRLWLFIPAIVFILTPIGFEYINNKIKFKVNKLVFFLNIILTIYLLINCLTYTGNKMYMFGGDINPLILYVQKNIKEGEKLYVHKFKRAQVHFIIGYSSKKIGNVKEDNIIYEIFAVEDFNENGFEKDLSEIIKNKKVYLITHGRMKNTMDILQNYGIITEVMNVDGNPLYFFELDECKDKEY